MYVYIYIYIIIIYICLCVCTESNSLKAYNLFMLLSIPLLKYERMRRRVDSVPRGVHAEAPSVYLLDLLHKDL